MTKELKEAIMEVMEESEERGRADGIAYSLLTVLSAKGKCRKNWIKGFNRR